MDNESYKNALIEIRKSFDSMKSFREINFDYVLCSDILDIVKGIYEDAVNRGINKVDILYIMDYYNTEKEKFNYVYPEERKKVINTLDSFDNLVLNNVLENNKVILDDEII